LVPPASARPRDALDVLCAFFKLGLTSFGGPVAHLGYFRREFVERRQWLDEKTYIDLVALCQFLPGPASSQVGFSIGLMRAGWIGGLAAWCGFTLPSVLLLIGFAVIAPDLNGPLGQGLIHGLKIAAVAVVAQAVWDMARRFCPDRRRAGIALIAVAILSMLATVYAQLLVIALGALLGVVLCRDQHVPADQPASDARPSIAVSRAAGWAALAAFLLLLFGLPAMSNLLAARAVDMFDAFYRSGALVFGGGHVVLPLLQQETVTTGWIRPGEFLAGYGAAQAMPGPLFTFAAFLGWSMADPPHQWAGACATFASMAAPRSRAGGPAERCLRSRAPRPPTDAADRPCSSREMRRT